MMRDYRFRLFIYVDISFFPSIDTLLLTTIQHKDKIAGVKSRE